MRRLTFSAIIVVPLLLWPTPIYGERTGKDFRCEQIPDVCEHFVAKHGERFDARQELSEIRVPELEPFIPGLRFYLTYVQTGDALVSVDMLAARSRDKEGGIVSSVSPLWRTPDPEFLALFEGVPVPDSARRPEFARSVARVLAEMTYGGSVTDFRMEGSESIATLRYKGTPLSLLRVQFAEDGRVLKVDVTDVRTRKTTQPTEGSAEDLMGNRSVSNLVQALTRTGLPVGLESLEVRSAKGKTLFALAREATGLSITFEVCGAQREGARKHVLHLAMRHGLSLRVEARGECARHILSGGHTNGEALGPVVAAICKEILRLRDAAEVSVSAAR